MYRITLILLLISCTHNSFSTIENNVMIPYLWRDIEFQFPTEADRSRLLQDGSYIPQNVVLNDVDVWADPIRGQETGGFRIFVSTPRVQSGIPITLSTVTNIRSGNSFLLAPFPDFQTNSLNSDCNGLVTVDKIHIDRCGLLWVLDTGRINEFVSPSRVCRCKLLIFDLKNNDQQILRYEFPDTVATAESSLTTTVTDSRTDTCLDSVAYIADLNGNGLVVFDLTSRTSWRVDHNFFYPYPRYGTYTISGVTFDLMDGVFGMSLGPRINDDRALYFHSMASVRQSWVPTSALRDQNLIRQQRDRFRSMFSVSAEFRNGQCSLEVMTDDGIMIYNDLIRNALMCWNTATPALKENTQMIYQDNVHLQFISGLKLKGDQLWIASNQVQNIMGNVTTSDNRYRIVFIKSIRNLLQEKGIKCLSRNGGTHYPAPHPPTNPIGGKPQFTTKIPPPIGKPPFRPPSGY